MSGRVTSTSGVSRQDPRLQELPVAGGGVRTEIPLGEVALGIAAYGVECRLALPPLLRVLSGPRWSPRVPVNECALGGQPALGVHLGPEGAREAGAVRHGV